MPEHCDHSKYFFSPKDWYFFLSYAVANLDVISKKHDIFYILFHKYLEVLIEY